jgi:cell wall-associated NlpC family hydrolase
MILRKYILRSAVLLCAFISFNLYAQETPKYAVANSYTPVLNTPYYSNVFGGESGQRVKLDEKGLIREMEFIAMPNTVFEIVETVPVTNDYLVYRVTTSDYQYDAALYIDSRFVTVTETKPEDRKQVMPSKEEIIKNLNALEGYTYMWGGNYGDGITKLLEYYQPAAELDEGTKSLWCLKGVDCSGLLYQATGGSTPRNTSSLIRYGTGLDIQGKRAGEIHSMLQPLDLIVWAGHVIIVLDENTAIESTPSGGVHKSDLLSRLKSVMSERTAVNDWDSSKAKRFVVRRWL